MEQGWYWVRRYEHSKWRPYLLVKDDTGEECWVTVAAGDEPAEIGPRIFPPDHEANGLTLEKLRWARTAFRDAAQ